ncbi:Uma2 family endonuclease [Nostoc edaphicum]|nr:Uma2 family endonuclease [Nostoc edaphicum]
MRSPIRIFLVAEYLKAESKSELRHEYLAGQIFAMSATGYA